MILAEASQIFDAAQFAAGLEAASRGAVRLQVTSNGQLQSLATGWLITDSLVVVPAFALSPDWTSRADTVHAVPPDGGEPIAVMPVPSTRAAPQGDQGAVDSSLPTLLRLATPLPKRALTLATEAPRPDDQVFLLHYPNGLPTLMLSMGKLLGLDGAWIRYDADTEPGSGGAPVLSGEWRVLGMHARSSAPNDPDGRFNAGVSVSAMLDHLRDFEAWPEIAAQHGLADVTSARQEIATANAASSAPEPQAAADDDLLTAAVSWTIDPASVRKDLHETVAALVIDPSQKRWMLRGNERAKLIAGSTLDQLRVARGSEAIPDLGQRVIDRILAGPPFDLEAIEEAELPFWLQAVRWFAGVVPDLPTPGAIHRSLAQRRSRSRLTDIAGPSFRGRKAELKQLDEWLDDPAGGLIAITGIGGVGKSALVAKLALDLVPGAVLLWLDFDRADLAPDNPASVLSILFDQLSLQLEGLELPPVDETSVEPALAALGSLVAPALAGRQVLLVLDGFEVAQHAPRHEEIWALIQKVLDTLPRTSVVVSGRAPVGNITLAGRTVRNLHLEGLDRADAEGWLRDAGVKRRDILDPVLELSRGVPLILRLAVGWLGSGGKVADLPERLPERMVEGFLYQRILDRVVDVELKPVARDILVLRYLTVEMLQPIVGDSIPKGMTPDVVFAKLAQEMALVGDSSEAALGPALPVTISAGPDRLILRPEVRAATVHLLETADARRVKAIDQRAARWYATQDLDDPAIRAEHVYHLLRAGSLKAAETAWRDECLPFLVGAEDDMPEEAAKARAWLRKRVQAVAHDPAAALTAWEADAAGRVRAMLVRGYERGVAEVLAEHQERAPGSPLVVYDAWAAWRAGDLARARALLAAAPPAEGPVGRDRAVLGARLAVDAGDVIAADELLASIEDDARWKDRPQAGLDATTVTAARVRLTIDLDGELELLQALLEGDRNSNAGPPAMPIPPTDVVLPLLARRLSQTGGYESLGERIPIPMSPNDYDGFANHVDERRIAAGRGLPVPRMANTGPLVSDPGGLGLDQLVPPTNVASVTPDMALRMRALPLEVLALRRWWLVAHGPFLARACDALLAAGRARDPQPLAIAGVLGAFVGNEWGPFRLVHPSAGPLDKLVRESPLQELPLVEPPPTAEQIHRATPFLNAAATDGIPNRPAIKGQIGDPLPASVAERGGEAARSAAAIQLLQAFSIAGPLLDGIGVYLLSPDPLDVLIRRVLGVPDQLAR